MTSLISLAGLLALAYATFSLINQHLHLTIPLYPPWQWALALTWPALGNRLALGRPRSLFWLLVFNIFLLLPAGGIFLMSHYPSGRWPAAVPVLLELAILWIPAAALGTQCPQKEEISRMWEFGLIVAALAALANEIGGRPIPLFLPALVGYLAVGVALRVVAAAAEAASSTTGRRRSTGPLTVSLGLLACGVITGLIVAGRPVAALLLSALKTGWYFLCLLAYYLVLLAEWLGLNRITGQPLQGLKIPGSPPPMESVPASQSAPLWLMVLFWIIMGVLLASLAWMLAKLLFETIIASRRQTAAGILPARRRLRRLKFRMLRALLAAIVHWAAKRLRHWQRRLRPHDISALYDAFAAWGRRNHRPRRRSETPACYLHRLEPEVRAFCPQLLPDLVALTCRYEQFCYGPGADAGLCRDEQALTRRLRRTPLHPRKLSGRLPRLFRRSRRETPVKTNRE